jgi:hypothetical protein
MPRLFMPTKLVQPRQQRGGRHRLAVDGDGIALLEVDGDVGRLVGRVLGRDGALVDALVGLLPGILEDLALARGVQEVGVDRERRLAALVLGDRDLMLLGKLDQLGARGEFPFAPWRDHLDVGLQCVIGELVAHLVVALAGGAVADRVSTDHAGDLDLALGDQRPGDRRAEKVLAFVERVGAEHREDEVLHELFAHVVDIDVLGLDAQHLGLLARGTQFLALAEVGGEGHDLAAIGLLQPLQDDGGVEAAGIGQHDFLDVALFMGPGISNAHDGRLSVRIGEGARI